MMNDKPLPGRRHKPRFVLLPGTMAPALATLVFSVSRAHAANTWGANLQHAASDLAQGNTLWMIVLFGLAIVLFIACVISMHALGRRNGNGSAAAVFATGIAAVICAGAGAFLATGTQTVFQAAPSVNGQAQVLNFQ